MELALSFSAPLGGDQFPVGLSSIVHMGRWTAWPKIIGRLPKDTNSGGYHDDEVCVGTSARAWNSACGPYCRNPPNHAQFRPLRSDLDRILLIESESQGGEEVTHQSVDLDARLHNARDTEERLTQILARKFEARSNRRKPSKRAYRTASVSRRSHSWRAKMGEGPLRTSTAP